MKLEVAADRQSVPGDKHVRVYVTKTEDREPFETTPDAAIGYLSIWDARRLAADLLSAAEQVEVASLAHPLLALKRTGADHKAKAA